MTLRTGETMCSRDIPVLYGDKKVFADPLSFVLKPNSTLSVCSPVGSNDCDN